MTAEELFEQWIQSEYGQEILDDATETEEPLSILKDVWLAAIRHWEEQQD